ncbi:MAG: hypothetical protein HY518_03415 [Candidatus Aenigmarchaeota archaeon]|nr:hypothetical protein [Candidatus Aenigmarchaeota archaeon]
MARKTHGRDFNLRLFVAAAATAIVLVSIAIAFLPAAVQEISVTHPVQQGQKQEAETRLVNSGQRIAITGPSTDKWKPGDSGIMSLSIMNGQPSEMTYRINIYQESYLGSGAPDTGTWFSYPRAISVPASSFRTASVVISTAGAPGSYFFRLLACKSEKCTTLGDQGVEAYASTQFGIKLEDF